MFELSFLVATYSILLNLILPFLAWILFLWLFFWNKFQGFLLYIFSWFSWIWVIFFSIFTLQFVHFWVWKIEYIGLILFLTFLFLLKVFIKKEKIKDYLCWLKIKLKLSFLKELFKSLNNIEKTFFIVWVLYLLLFISLSFAHNLSFPNYFDDSFWNWNTPAMNIFYDSWFKVFWDKNEILWHGRLGYPIFIPIYKAIITDFIWYWNDIYSNLFQYFCFLFLIFFVIHISYKETKNLLLSILPAVLIIWLPLVYFHTLEWYLELPSATYAVLTIYSMYKYLENSDIDFAVLWILFWIILASLKNDWIIVYLPWIIFAFLFILFQKKELKYFLKSIFDKYIISKILFLILFFFLPFLILKSYYWVWFNQAAWEESSVWFEKIHTEIFPMFKQIFINQDNYNISLIIIWILIYFFYKNKNNYWLRFVLFAFLFVFIIITLVFLFTSNYRFVMDQTTVNRVFSMVIILLFSFSSYFLKKYND